MSNPIRLLFLFAFIYCHTGIGQQEKQSKNEQGNYYWLDISSGFASEGVTGSVAANAEINTFTIGAEFRETNYGEFLDFFGPPDPSAKAINLTGGKLFKGDWWLIHLSGGLGAAQLRTPRKIGETGGWFSTGIYEYDYSGVFSHSLKADASFTLNIFKIGLCAGFTATGGQSTPYAGLSIGFGKFF